MDKPQTTLGRDAYRAIKSAIRDGLYRPGDRLREEEVAERFGISRTPVREALTRLHEKGLLEAAPGRGLAVTVLDMQRIFEIYALRLELESVVARFAAQHATDVEITNLEQINRTFAVAVEPADAARLNRVFHARLYDAARNRYLQAAVEELQDSIALLPQTTFVRDGRIAEAAEEHTAIIDAIRKREVESAWQAGRNHIAAALQARLTIVQAQ